MARRLARNNAGGKLIDCNGRAAAQLAARRLAQPTEWKQVPIPPLPPFKPQQPKRMVLANGMVVFLTENHELPFISAASQIRGGADSEPAIEDWTGGNVRRSWRTGGTEKLSGDQLDDLLEARAAKVETSGSEAYTTIGLQLPQG